MRIGIGLAAAAGLAWMGMPLAILAVAGLGLIALSVAKWLTDMKKQRVRGGGFGHDQANGCA